MSSKAIYYLAAFVGSIVGAYLPQLWGAGMFSLASVFFSAVGGIVGIVVVWKLFN